VTGGERAGAFIATKEHRRFSEFADVVRQHRYICFGAAGVGKTLSARRYAKWDVAEPLLVDWGPRQPSDATVYAAVAGTRTVFYTPTVCCPFREVRDGIAKLVTRAGICIDEHLHREEFVRTGTTANLAELLMSRYPQLYSRVGFAHHYRPLRGDELTFVLTCHWRQLGLALDEVDFTDAQAMALIARITGGNFRLLHRLFVQIGRILKINGLSVITDDVVEAARSTLVIGAT
jgi:DNA transposition AAA+ family ATPase